MTDVYPVCRLGAVASVQGGFAFKSGDFTETGVPVLKIKNVRLREVDTTEPAYVDQSVAKDTARYFCKTGDLLISMTGSGPQAPNSVVGRVARFTGPSDRYLINQRVGRFVNKAPDKLDQRYLFYVLAQDETLWKLVSVATGSANQANISGSQIESLEVPLPPLTEQKAIAVVLGALDDKIELNRRMNATLEAMARALFHSWFVDFDPVRAKLDARQPVGLDKTTADLFPSSFQDSPVGHIPKGWEVRPLSEAFDIKDGATFRKEDRVETGNIIAFGANGPVGFSTRANVIEPCIGLGKIGSCGSLHRSWKPCWVTNNAFIVKPHPSGSLEFVWRTLCTIDFSQFIGGSANPYMPLKNFGHTPVVMPPVPLLNAYQERAGSLAGKIVANDEQSRTLSTLRDTLLPKLLSGELSVTETY
ncbi:restriction endonuclease subunit S [Synechococcus sp. RedBA-s]|uniref:restriction endonuclease subunit S n=1 Tax=Synechococcus sp. RedBA-s TaxID=2823741 RepID=UPI0020CD5D1F|nr:restriction endonuclease subunit S [Synechococcus sp. RedBA-s]MCP9800252.1 restriction endonuclease subunit S [Synechococcus sp. RedBA-s]